MFGNLKVLTGVNLFLTVGDTVFVEQVLEATVRCEDTLNILVKAFPYFSRCDPSLVSRHEEVVAARKEEPDHFVWNGSVASSREVGAAGCVSEGVVVRTGKAGDVRPLTLCKRDVIK